MPAFRANPGVFKTQTPHGLVTFRPKGKIHVHGPVENPASWSTKTSWAARFFVGFNVDEVPTWDLHQVVEIFKGLRKAQTGGLADASFVAQKGIYTSKRTGKEIEEDGAQIILLAQEGPQRQLENEMPELAEALARELKQEEIIVEIQRNGVTKNTIGIVP